ncbi:MAG: hypothetical protein EOM50_02160 [Erysipelotrichia bacterium]|nr:hypothetical protein [Erysipelotrichia bacterium]
MDATIIAALIAALTSIISSFLAGYSIYITKKGNKENIESNKEISSKVQEAENIRTEIQVDANIIWKARVEWIQNVRRVTAEFVTTLYKYVHSDPSDTNELNKNLEMLREKKCLLILYFGPDELDIIDKLKAQNIYDKNTNNEKNEMVVDLINSLFNSSREYFSNESLRIQYHSDGIVCIKCKYKKQTDCMYAESETDCIENQKKQLNLERECIKKKEKLFNDVEVLIEAMRIYLKLEWKYAKSRKK